MGKFVVMAHRSAASFAGAGESPAKGNDGNVMFFDTREAAQAKADEWTARLTSRKVWYTVEEAR